MSRKFINVDKDSEEYGWVYSEIRKLDDGCQIEVENEPLFSKEIFNPWQLKEISEVSYKKIMNANAEGDSEKETELKDYILSRRDDFLYVEQLQRDNGIYSICDKDMESSVAFTNLKEFKKLIKDSPEYVADDSILISGYFLAATGELLPANLIMDELERHLVGRDHAINIDCLVKFTKEEFLEEYLAGQIKMVADAIRNKVK